VFNISVTIILNDFTFGIGYWLSSVKQIPLFYFFKNVETLILT